MMMICSDLWHVDRSQQVLLHTAGLSSRVKRLADLSDKKKERKNERKAPRFGGYVTTT